MTRTSILLLVLGVGPAICQTTGWKLNWSDEFSGAAGSAPDSSKWAYDTGAGGWGNNELENYTTSTANSFQDGRRHLVIQALNVNGGYTSARLKTQSTFSLFLRQGGGANQDALRTGDLALSEKQADDLAAISFSRT